MAQRKELANAIRALSMDAVQKAKSGHPGAPMGMADIAEVLWNDNLKHSPSNPKWSDRDRFILSNGHGSMLIYSLLHLTGYDLSIDDLKNFRQLHSKTPGHPEYGYAPGVETTTGPLGQGITNAVGMAIAERSLAAEFNRDGHEIVDHNTWVFLGDGCLMEGISHEAIDFAGHMGLGRLVVLWDDNNITIDGNAELSTSTDQKARFAACGWHVQAVDGHDKEAVARAIAAAKADPRPSLIACKTIIGFGAPNKQGTSATHGSPLGADEVAATRAALGWGHAPFEIPAEVYEAWQALARRGQAARIAWESRLTSHSKRAAFAASHGGVDAAALGAAITEYRRRLSAERPKVATRNASEMALEIVNGTLPNSIGGSADLTGSNNTRTKGMVPVSRDNYGGDYIHYGIREHGMAAIMNGMALHGGFKPYGGTFLAFADYCRPAIRLSALMQVPVVYVMTHDSIGLGEDGPTHQPVEQLASLRAMPNLNVFRPADVVETAEAWEIAITDMRTPSVLALSRQNLPCLRTTHCDQNKTARGAYVLREASGTRDVTLIATGSEVEIALAAADRLETEGKKAAVVSAPCFELFERQDAAYKAAVLGKAPRVGVEAAVRQGWGDLLGPEGAFVGMTGFGASAPAEELYEHFGITAGAVAEAARKLMK